MTDLGGLMSPTVTPSQGLIPDPDPAILREKLLTPSVSLVAVGPTNSLTKGTAVQIDVKANTIVQNNKLVITGYTTKRTEYAGQNLRSVSTNRNSISTPDYFQLLKTGGMLPVNPFSNQKFVRNYNFVTSERISTYNGQPYETSYMQGPWYNPDIPQATGSFTQPTLKQLEVLDREARLKIRLALKNQKVNVAMIIAERDKTASSIAKIVKTIAELVLQLRRGDIRGAAGVVGRHVGFRKKRQFDRSYRSNPTEALANAWLEFQYAIKPLLMDINGLVEELAAHQYPRATGIASATKTLKIDVKRKVGNLTIHEQGSVKLRYVVYFQIDYPEMPSITRLGLTNPVQLAWELIPFSFVLDWLLPIGDWLSSLDATVGLRFSDGSKSLKRDLSQTYMHDTTVRTSGPSTWGFSTSQTRTVYTSSYSEDSVTREKLFSFPSVAFPPFKNPASIVHLASALALLRKTIFSTRR